MAGQVKFCRSCGKQINADAAFCRFCGFRFDAPAQPEPLQQAQQNAPKKKSLREQMKENYEAGKAKGQAFATRGKGKKQSAPAQETQAAPQQPVQSPAQTIAPVRIEQTPQPQAATKFCNQCGKQINADAPFCRFCGNKFDVPTQSGAAQASTNVAATVAAVNPYVQKIASAVQMPQRLFASANAGEFTLGEGFSLGNITSNVNVGGVNLGVAQKKINEVLSPAKVLGSSIKSFFGGIFGVFKNPKALISTLLLAAAWIVLPMLKNGGADNGIIDLLSWLTCAEGGLNRSAAGMLGGMIGKGSVAVALGSLLTGGLGATFKGFGALFTGGGEKRSIPAILVGVLLGAALGVFYMGLGTGAATSMAGISGVLLSLQSLGGQGGFARSFVESLTAKTVNGIRTAQNGAVNGLFTGTTAGFAAITAIAALL